MNWISVVNFELRFEKIFRSQNFHSRAIRRVAAQNLHTEKP